MKQTFTFRIFAPALFFFLMLVGQYETSFGQDTIPKKYKVDLKLWYTKTDNLERIVKISVSRKEGNEMVPVKWVIVNLYLNEITKLGMLGNITSDQNGEGIIPLDLKFKYVTDSLGVSDYKFIASLQNNPDIETTFTELEVREAELTLDLFEQASVKKLKAVLRAVDSSGVMNPVAGSKIYFSVTRNSVDVPLFENSFPTDINGEVIADFPGNIESDSADLLSIFATTDVADRFGVLNSKKIINWGIPGGNKNSGQRKSLWEFFIQEKYGVLIMCLLFIATAVFYFYKKKKVKS